MAKITVAPKVDNGLSDASTVTPPSKIRLAPGANSAPGLQATPSQQVVPDVTDYDTGYIEAFGDRNKYRVEQQTGWQMWRNALTQGVAGEMLLGTAEGAGYLLDLEQWGNILTGTEQEFGNWLSDIAKEGKEELRGAAPVFQTEEAKHFAPWDSTWWAGNSPSILSALSLMVPARGASMVAGRAAKVLGASRIPMSKLGREVASGVTTAMFSRYMENTMEASQVFDQTYNEALTGGMSLEQAKAVAGEAASTAWYANLANLGTDILQYTMLARGVGGSAKAASSGSRALDFGKQIASEALEETGQAVISSEARQAALKDFDPFGEGFATRLVDYIADPELQTAAFFGGLGGGVFAGIGAIAERQFQPKYNQVLAESLAKERADQLGDVEKARALDNLAFSRLAFKHISNGSADVLEDDLSELGRDPNITPEAKQSLNKHKENLKFLTTQYGKLLSNPEVPNDLVIPTLGTQFDVKLTSEEVTDLKQKTSKQINDVLSRGEIDPEVRRIKEIYHTIKGYEQLAAKTKQDFSEPIKFYDDLMWRAIKDQYQGTEVGKTTPIYDLILSSEDPQIQDSYNKLVAQSERLNVLKKDLGRLTTAEGKAEYAREQAEKKAIADAQKLVSDPKVTVGQLEQALGAITNPQARQALESKLSALKQAKQETNKVKTEQKVAQEQAKPKQKEKEIKPAKQTKKTELESFNDIDPNNFLTEDEPSYQDDINLIFGAVDTAEPPVDVPEGAAKEEGIATIEQGKLVIKRLETESPGKPSSIEATVEAKQTEAKAPVIAMETKGAKTVLKEIAGKYNEEGVFIPELNADTTPIKQKYGNLSVEEVFDSQNGILTVNTPNIAPGMEVAIKVEPNWAFFKSSDPDKVVLNVYRVAENGRIVGKPLTQIPSSANPKTSTPQTRALRESIMASGKEIVRTRVIYKNSGDLLFLRNQDGSRLENSLSVLEIDMKEAKNGWIISKTDYNPILAYVDPSQIVQAPNVERMKGVDTNILKRVTEMNPLTKAKPGTVMVLRTNPSGGFSFAQVDPRRVSVEEYDWLKANLATYLAERRYNDLKTLINIEQAGIEENIAEHSSKVNPKLVVVAGDAAFEVPHNNTSFWVKINATGEYGSNFTSFMAGDNFSFQVYDADGTKKPALQHSESLSPQLVEEIRSAFDNLLRNSFKNVDKNFLNSEGTFVDVFGNQYKSYYEYLKQTNSVTTDLPAGYSFFNTTIYLDQLPTATKTTVEPITKEIQEPVKPETKQDIIEPKPTEEKKKPKRKIDWDKAADEETDTRYRLTSAAVAPFKIMSQQELDWMQDKFGPEYLSIASSVDRVISSYGLEAFGYYHNANIILAQFAEEGSGYHEAFHFVTLTQLSPAQYEKMITEAGRIYGKDKNRLELEETLAEDFRTYMLSDGSYVPRVQASRNLFQRILDYIRKALGFKTSIERLFENVANFELTAEAKAKLALKRSLAPLQEVDDLRHRLVKGFSRVNQQLEAINDSTHRLLQKAMNLGEKEGVGFDDILENPNNVAKLLDEIYNEYKSALNAANKQKEQYEEGEIDLSDDEVKTLSLQARSLTAIVENWNDIKDENNTFPGYQTTLVQNLGKYGFSVKIKEVEPTPVAEDEENLVRNEGDEIQLDDPNAQERVHGVSFLLQSPLKTLSAKVKRFLSSIPEYERNEDGTIKVQDNKPVISETLFGTPKFIDFNKVYSNLSSKLAGHKDLYKRLAELAATDPIFAGVKDQLDIHIKNGQTAIDGVPAQFFTAFNRSKYRFFTTLVGYEDGKPTARVIETDRRNIERTIITDWENNSIKKGLLDTDGQVNTKKAATLLSSLETLKAKGKAGTYDENREFFEKTLSAIGVELPKQVWDKLDKGYKRSTDLNRMLFGKEAATLETSLETAAAGSNPFDQTGLFTQLADLSKDYVDDLQAKSFINEKGNQVSAINLNTYITDLISELTNPDTGTEKVKWFQQDKFYVGNEFLTTLLSAQTRKGVQVNIFSAFRDGTSAQAKEYQDTTVQDSFVSRLTAWFNSGNKSGYIYLGTLSDKAQQLSVLLPKRTQNASLPFLKDILRKTVDQEIARIIRLKKQLTGTDNNITFSPNEVASYKNAAKFLYMPALNNIPGLTDSLSDGTLDPDDLSRFEVEINKVINEFIANEENIFFEKLGQLGLISKSGNRIVNEGLPAALEQAGSLNTLLRDFFYNDFGWRMEMSKVFHGDIAFYKNAETYFKRGYQIITPGLQGYYNSDIKSAGKKESYKRGIFVSSIKTNSPEYLAQIGSLITPGVTPEDIIDAISSGTSPKRGAEIAAKYATVNKTDAQSFSTIATYRDVAMSVGQWTDDHEFAYNLAWRQGKSIFQAGTFSGMAEEQKKHLLSLEGKLLLQPLKPFTFGDRMIRLSDGSTMILKEQFKESITPLLPEWANKHPQFKTLLAAMERDNIDIMSDSEAVKVGSYAVNTDLNQPIVGRDIPVNQIRFPFFVPEKAKTEILAGTQIEKLIVGNIEPKSKYKLGDTTINGEELISEYHNTWSSIIKNDYEDFKKLFDLEENLRVPESRKLQFLKDLKEVLIGELSHRDLPDNYFDSLLIIKNKLDQPEFMVGLDFPALGKKYEQILTGLFKKNLMTQKLPGDSLINLADFGIDKTEDSSELAFITNKDNKLVEAEVGVPHRFIKGLGLKMSEVVDSATGKIIWDKLSPEQQSAMQLIIYRIPTQGKNSMIPVRIARILPDSAGSVIMIPGEMTKQGGMDFDVDKSYVMKRTTTKGKIDKTEANKLFDIHWTILTSPHHTEEVLNPLDSTVHDEMIAYLEQKGVVSRAVKNSPFSVVTDLEMEKLAKYSKAMIGIFSKFSVGHATLQAVPDQVSVKVPINIENEKYRYDAIGKLRDDQGTLISDNHSAQQNSALDAQKDPKLGYLNITTFNASTLAYMTDLGVNQKLALAFMNQPVLRELSDEFFKNGDNNLNNAVKNLTDHYTGLETLLTQTEKKKISPINPGNLDEGLTLPVDQNLQHQAQVLSDFIKYYYAALDMARVNTALSSDTVRDFTSIAAIQNYVDTINYVTTAASKVELNPDIFVLSKSKVKRVAAFYNYAIRAALQFTKQFYPYNSPAFTAVRTEIAKATLQKNDKLRDKEDILAIDHAMTYYMFGENNELESILNKFSPNYSQRWSFFTASHSIGVYLEKMKKKHERLEKNLLIQALRQEELSRRGSIQMLGINNTHGNFNKTNLTNAWWDLMTDPNPEIKTLAYDLVRFAIQTSGFKTTPTSFVDIIPAQFWRDSGLASYHSALTNAYSEGAKSVDAINAAKVVIRHIFNSTNLVKTVPFRKDGDGNSISNVSNLKLTDPKGTHVVEFEANESTSLFDKDSERKWATYARMFDKQARRWRLYERQGGSRVYREIQPLGENNRFVEFTSNGDAKSKHPANENLRPAYLAAFKDQMSDANPYLFENYPHYVKLGITDYGALNAKDVLTNVVATEPDRKRKEIGQKMLDNIDKLNDTNVSLIYHYAAGVFNPAKNEIGLNGFLKTEEQVRHTVLHELIHAYTVRVIRDPKTDTERNFVDNITRVYNDTKKFIKSDEYGLTSIEEFIAELASNKEFRQLVRRGPSLWTRLIRAIRRLFGFRDDFDAIIDQLYNVLDEGEDLQYRVDPDSTEEFRLETKANKELSTIFSKMKKGLERRIDRLMRFGQDYNPSQKVLEELTQLSQKEALVVYVANTIRDINTLVPELKKTLSDNDKVAAKKLRQFKEQLSSYNVLKEIRKHVHRNAKDYAEMKKGDKTFIAAIDEVLAKINSLETDVNEASIATVARWVQENTNQNMTIEEVEEQLRTADRDITLINRGLDAIVDSRDAVLRIIGKQVINTKANAFRKTEKLLKEKWLDVNEKYEEWLKSQKIDPSNLRERHKPILDPTSFMKESKGIYFIDPDSKSGQAILKRPANDPLRRYYEMVVVGYLKAQKTIPRHMRPGVRVPSIRRSAWELFTEEQGSGKLRVLKQSAIDAFRRTYDETDFQATDEAGNPIDFLPIRFISRQDGQEGRMSVREVSLDLSSTVLMFIDEMNTHDGLLEIVHDLELAKDVLASRQVAVTKRTPGLTGLLSPDRMAIIDQDGYVQTTSGRESNSYKMAEQFISRMVYGNVKKSEGNITLGKTKIDFAKSIDTLLRYTGIRMMAGNLNVAFSNIATGEATMLKEAVGGRWFKMKDWTYGKKMFAKEVIPYAGEIGQRKKTSKFGVVFETFNPEDQQRGNLNLGKDNTVLKRVTDTKNLNFLNDITTLEMNGSLMFTVMNTIKVNGPEGETNLYDALDVKDGVMTVKKGYTYNGKPITEADLNAFRNRMIAISQRINGIYNVIDSPGIRAYSWGRLVMLMRNWLKPGIDARWKLQYHDERLGSIEEGYYISAIRFFKNMFGPEGYLAKDIMNLKYLVGLGLDSADFLTATEKEKLTEEQQKELSELRRANFKKTLFELYLIASLSALAMFGWDEDDDRDSLILYHIVRLKRELSTFFSPTEAWSVLRSPTVALDTIQRFGQFVDSVTTGVITGEGFEEYKQGPSKGEIKMWSQLQNKIPVWSQRNQFEDLDKKVDLIERGWK